MKSKVIFLTLLIALISCDNSSSNDKTSRVNGIDNIERPITIPCDLQKSSVGIIENGDTMCYQDLQEGWVEEEMDFMLPYALVMSMKYNYSSAYIDVYYSLNPKSELLNIDPTTLKLIQFCEYKLRHSDNCQECAQRIVDDFTRDSIVMNQYKGKGLFEYLMSVE